MERSQDGFSSLFPLVLGIILSFCGATLSTLGIALMKREVDIRKYAPLAAAGDSSTGATFRYTGEHPNQRLRHHRSFVEELDKARRTSAFVISHVKDFKWFIGLIVFFIGQLSNLVALFLLQQIVWAVLSLFSLVSNAIFSAYLLEERFTRSDCLATLAVMVGSAIVLVSIETISRSEKQGISLSTGWDPNDLVSSFSRPSFISYCVVLICILVLCIGHGIFYISRGRLVHPVTWTIFSATSGAVSVLCGKLSGKLVMFGLNWKDSDARNVWASPETYVVFSLLLVAALSALLSLNLALASGDALLVVPVLTMCNTALTIFGGMFYFQEFGVFQSLPHAIMFLSGLFLSLWGALRLHRSHGNSKPFAETDLQSTLKSEPLDNLGAVEKTSLL